MTVTITDQTLLGSLAAFEDGARSPITADDAVAFAQVRDTGPQGYSDESDANGLRVCFRDSEGTAVAVFYAPKIGDKVIAPTAYVTPAWRGYGLGAKLIAYAWEKGHRLAIGKGFDVSEEGLGMVRSLMRKLDG